MAELPAAERYDAIIVAGPTASGKSRLAVELAERCGGEIVGADAFQIYAGLPILTAQPEAELRARAPHHLIGEVPLSAAFDVAQYLRLATDRLAEIRARGHRPIVVGGTGLYLRALLRGLADLPPADDGLRGELAAEPLASLQERLRQLDPVSAAAIDLHNPRRVIRALEVCLLTGRPFSSFRQEWAAPPASRPAGIWLHPERSDLHRRIEQRVEEMFARGVVAEVAHAPIPGPTSGQTLGLREIQSVLAGQLSLQDGRDRIAQATRQYAKRQFTWLRREPALQCLTPAAAAAWLRAGATSAAG